MTWRDCFSEADQRRIERHFGYIEKGVYGDVAAEMADEDVAREALARFIAEQPPHNISGRGP